MAKKKAVALNYQKEQQHGAPRIVAVGEGYVAEKILDLARNYGIPVVEDVELVDRLVKFPPGTEIPPQLYEAVARVLAFIYRLENEKR
ncbi:MAG: EscU/YscU/HrcU family type III secretion system export apparatus switch protein [Peptococcaceae bacterium]|jgi:flagellar biosynthesis protein|nr:EscU/YscU/HrcU family type III secretion system export apparatus switch protein [Peptococcaceae bacterium]MDH7525723.1 EscU/YscU/HrcU family type III secretion system export apparatus switch protein [Peptococcaceae bacterium]